MLVFYFKYKSMETKIVAVSAQELRALIQEALQNELSRFRLGMYLNSEDDELWDRKKAANFLGISEQTLVKLVNEEKLVAQRSGRKYHFLKSNVLKYLNPLN